MIRSIHKKPKVDVIISGKTMNAFSLKLEKTLMLGEIEGKRRRG